MQRGEVLAKVAEHVDDIVAKVVGAGRNSTRLVERAGNLVEIADVGVDAVVDIDRAAAAFPPPRVITDQADAEIAVGLNHNWPRVKKRLRLVNVVWLGGAL